MKISLLVVLFLSFNVFSQRIADHRLMHQRDQLELQYQQEMQREQLQWEQQKKLEDQRIRREKKGKENGRDHHRKN